MQLKLYIPKTEQALQQKPELRTGIITERLEKLSSSEPEEAAQEIAAELGRLNRTEIDEEVRGKLNLLYEPVVRKLIEALITTLPENGTPQSTAHRQIATLMYELALELSYAWKLAYIGLEQRRSLFGNSKTRQNTLIHLLNAISDLISTSYRTYASPPSQCWYELHQVQHALQQENDRASNAGNADSERFEAAYKRTLLLALANPFRLSRLEMDVTLAYLDKFNHLAKLSPGRAQKKSVFCIDTKVDSPYCHEGEPDSAEFLAFDTHAVCKHLRGQIVKLKTGDAWREIGLPELAQRIDELSLLSRLHQAWRGSSKRGFNRYVPEMAHVDVISGIPAIHRLFDKKLKPATSEATGKRVQNKSPSELTDQSQPSRWRVLNDSASGLSITSHAQEVSQLRLGNLIAMRMEGEEGSGWVLGIIRWGKMSKGQISAGVEKLAPTASSVVLRMLHGNVSNIGQPALLIPANPALQIDERLLLPHGLYKRGYNADMWLNGKSRRIALGSLAEQTPFFDVVELEPT